MRVLSHKHRAAKPRLGWGVGFLRGGVVHPFSTSVYKLKPHFSSGMFFFLLVV